MLLRISRIPTLQRYLHSFVQRSEKVQFKKCKFQAHLYKIETTTDVQHCLNHIVENKKVAKASHPHIFAYRLSCGESGAVSTGFDDDGESGAGKRLLALLENRDLENTLIAVTRWYGGSHLGGARFRAITNCAKQVL